MLKQFAILTAFVGVISGCGTPAQSTTKTVSSVKKSVATQTAEEAGTEFINDLGKKDYQGALSFISSKSRKSISPEDLANIAPGFDSISVQKIIKELKLGNFDMIAFGVKEDSSKAKGNYYYIDTFPFMNESGHWYVLGNDELQQQQQQMFQQFNDQVNQDNHDQFIQMMKENDRQFQDQNRLFMEQVQRDMETAQQTSDQANQDTQQVNQQAAQDAQQANDQTNQDAQQAAQQAAQPPATDPTQP